MQIAVVVAQIVIALGIANVWLLRSQKASAYRGGNAKDMLAEFAAYGLPAWVMRAVGATKLTLATALVVGIWVPMLVRPAAIGMAFLMFCAIAMHVKVSDAPQKSLPAFCMLALSVFVAVS